MKLMLKFTHGLFLFSLLPLVSLGTDFNLTLVSSTNTYTLGDPIPIVVEFIYKGRGIYHFNESDISIKLKRVTDGRILELTGSMGPRTSCVIKPDSVMRFEWDINKLYSIKESGQYAMEALYQAYVLEMSLVNGVETDVTRLVAEAYSDKVFFTVLPLDQQKIDNIERLLHSKKDDEQLEGIALLSKQGNGIYREMIPTLWSIVLERKSPVSDKAFILILERIDLSIEVVPISELFSELADATTSPDEALRVAVAESIPSLKYFERRRDEDFRFYLLKISQWFERETSSDCRVALVRTFKPGYDGKGLITIIQEDPSPEVRFTAIKRLEYDPLIFLKSADSFTNLVGQVTIDGKEISLEEFVKQEQERLSKRYK